MTTTGVNVQEYTVSELSGALKRTIEDTYGYVRVRGELGRVTRAGSGHVYLDMKDERAVLSGVIWKGVASRMRIQPEQGLEVIATGRLSTFPGQSRYQIIIESLEPAGLGALMALLEERKKKLGAEGLFDAARKRPLPKLPEVIGVVTSPTGAVIRDILHRLRDRFPRHVIVWPTLVQGEKAAEQIAAGIAGFNFLEPGGDIPRPDVLIVARGGGSIEDLWAFNEEIVVRAAAASDIPLISAVGHETDTTLIDYAADVRAPTPTAAAELAVPVRAELQGRLNDLAGRLTSSVLRGVDRGRDAVRAHARALGRPERLLETPEQRLDRASERMTTRLRARIDRAATAFHQVGARYSPAALRAGLATRSDALAVLSSRMQSAERRLIERRADRIASIRLPGPAIRNVIARHAARANDLNARGLDALRRVIYRREQLLASAAKLLQSLSHESVLARGFVIVRREDGALLRAARDAVAGEQVALLFRDGERKARIDDNRAKETQKTKPKTKAEDQGTLL